LCPGGTSNDTGGNVLNPSAGVLKESITGKRRQIVLFVKKRADVYVFRIWDQFEVFASAEDEIAVDHYRKPNGS
jgi:hypothetical protein